VAAKRTSCPAPADTWCHLVWCRMLLARAAHSTAGQPQLNQLLLLLPLVVLLLQVLACLTAQRHQQPACYSAMTGGLP
jgi:hypothetical protein